MQVFKKTVLFLALLLAVILLLQFALGPIPYYEDAIAEFNGGGYDSIVIGSSYGNNIDPRLLPEGERVYNLSRPNVPLVDFYYLVREFDKTHDLKTIYLDVCVPYWTGELGDINRINMLNILTGANQAEYFTDVLLNTSYNDFFFRYEVNSNTLRKIPTTMKEKLRIWSDRRNQVPRGPSTQGFNFVTDKGDPTLNPENFSPDKIDPKSLEVFEDLVRYCEEQDIQLVGFMTALPQERLRAENLGEVHDYFTQVFVDYGLPLYDFNYIPWEIFPRPTEDFHDMDGHMMGPLAQTQSRLFSEILTAGDPASYFLPGYESVLQNLPS